ncbi:MAG: Maf family protein [Lachnospiraceae bacterium]
MSERYKLILASASPRRKELLEQIGIKFEILPAKGEEILTSNIPSQAVLELSKQKATEVAEQVEKSILNLSKQKMNELVEQKEQMQKGIVVLGADTIVVFKDKILGKPKDTADAINMLQMLSGNIHSVFTGVTLFILEEDNKRIVSFYEETKVSMYSMTKEEITAYVKTKEPMDKAGAYGIQGRGARYIERMEGDYYNVVGLPIGRIYQELYQSGIEIF